MTKKILLTSVCQPLGPDFGDGPSVGYELLHGQVTRAQGMFSPRAVHIHFSLEYIATNLSTPATVLQYPTRAQLIRELKKGYDFVGVSFILAVFHRMKEVVALIREHAPNTKIILGGYGTVLPDDVLKPYADYICREEGVRYIRNLLGEPEIPMPYQHPVIVSRLKVFSVPVSRTGMVFAGLGCPNGCDFCCTSHFFKRRHIRLLPTGRDIYNVVMRYHEVDPNMPVVVLDEDFLLNKQRALEFRDCVLEGGKPLSIFVFSSIKAISQYTVEQILEMGIDGFWIGYEGTRSGYGKQSGRPADELFRELREHGITILASMIVGFPYQTPEIVEEELAGLLSLKPTLGQFLIYGPTPGTPFYNQIMNQNLLREDLKSNPESYYRKCDGFTAMVQHPTLTAPEIEAIQRKCFEKDFQVLGPSIYRSLETAFLGYLKLKDSPNEFLRKKAAWFASEARKGYPIFLAGRLFGPNRSVRRWIAGLERQLHAELGAPTWKEQLMSAISVGMALWTGLTLKLKIFQHPPSQRHLYRQESVERRAAHDWSHVATMALPLSIEKMPEDQVHVRLHGLFNAMQGRELGARLRRVIDKKKERLVVDLAALEHLEAEAVNQMLQAFRDADKRLRVILPEALAHLKTAGVSMPAVTLETASN